MLSGKMDARALGLVLALLGFAGGGAVQAAPSCYGVLSTGVAFGAYNPLSPVDTDSVGNIYYYCPGALPPAISISSGSAASFSPRQMTSFAEVMSYNLYTDATRTAVWGDGTGGSSTVVGPNSPFPVVEQVYGRIFALQSVAAGNYSDTLLVTLNF
ncbi:MAG: hypothetical protein NVS2B9_12910 [Myxococcales bacterium]